MPSDQLVLVPSHFFYYSAFSLSTKSKAFYNDNDSTWFDAMHFGLSIILINVSRVRITKGDVLLRS